MKPGLGDLGELRVLFARALELPPERRFEFLNDPSITVETRDELLALLEADQGSETYLEGTVDSERTSESRVGERFGAYETLSVLGHGGMGVVFKAHRVDGELNQTVAIKVVRHTWLNPRALDRFRNERQLLASLVHSNIARLLDGGTREDGVAYLVMEYVSGVPLDRYCDQRGLDIAERVGLCLPLCDAVEYAHTRLVIHRDLKPSNVLVTAAGEPKLLDFGIARALDAEPSGETNTLMMTPEFASPEQARGEEATTATDVYGLGGVLYFLLTGRSTHKVSGLSRGDLQRAISETPPQLPGLLQPKLKGDLENILLKALHAVPQRRYRSARELRDDLERFLDRRPVLATRDGWAYRTKRFLQRHTVASVAAALALIAVVAGTAESLYQAHRAQQRFAQVRTLANRFVFDFEAAIRDTPGTLEARRMVASTAREYLADLAADTGSNPALNRELAQSYYSLGRVESSAGENDAALEHLQKSRQIHKQLHDDCCGPPIERLRYITAVTYLARFMIDSRTPDDSVLYANEALDAARAWYAQSPKEPMADRAMALAQSNAGIVLLNREKRAEGVKLLQEAELRFERLVQQFPADDDLKFQMARSELSLANRLPGPEPSPTRLKLKARVDEFLARHPANTRWRNLAIYVASSDASVMHHLAADNPSLTPRALEAYREAYNLAKVKVQQSPGDLLALDDLATMSNMLGNELTRENKFKEAESYFLEALQNVDQLIKVDPADRRNLYLEAINLCALGDVYGNSGKRIEQAGTLERAEMLSQDILKKWPGDLLVSDVLVSVLVHQTQMQRQLGHVDEARKICKQSLEAAADLMARAKENKHPVSAWDDLKSEARMLGVTAPTLIVPGA